MSMGVAPERPYRRLVWTETVTVFHRTVSAGADGKTVTTWARFVVSGCFYGWKRVQRISGTDTVADDARVVRIPAENVPVGFEIEPGDVIALGTVDALPEAPNLSEGEILRRLPRDGFIVGTARRNTALPETAHYFASEVGYGR